MEGWYKEVKLFVQRNKRKIMLTYASQVQIYKKKYYCIMKDMH